SANSKEQTRAFGNSPETIEAFMDGEVVDTTAPIMAEPEVAAEINARKSEHRILVDGSVVIDPQEIMRIRSMAIPKEMQDQILEKYYRTGYLPRLPASENQEQK